MKPKDVAPAPLLIKIIALERDCPNDQTLGKKVRALIKELKEVK
jgi:hypothetical protein